ncbi:MAG: LysM peptidoglycan-binding domain-containing protein [Roseburia sp.]
MYCNNKIVHTIKEGDSLYKLSKQYMTTVTELIMGNPGVNPYNLQVGMKLTICPGPGYKETEQEETTADELTEKMERAWMEHVMLARMFMVSFLNNLPDLDAISGRMQRNVGEITNLFSGYFPVENRNRMKEMLTEHEQTFAALLGDLKSGNQESYNQNEKKWYDEGMMLADFLSRANPAYRRRDLNRYLEDHLRLLLSMANEYWNADYEKSMETYDIAREQAEELGRYLAENLR